MERREEEEGGDEEEEKEAKISNGRETAGKGRQSRIPVLLRLCLVRESLQNQYQSLSTSKKKEKEKRKKTL